MKERLAILISGGGSTMQQIIKSVQSKELDLDIACVISSNPDAGGIRKALDLGIPQKDVITVDPKDKENFAATLINELKIRNVTVVSQNGWLPLTPPIVINQYKNSIFNQHPGIVPDFGGKGMYGRRVHAATLLFRRLTKRDYWTNVIVQKVALNFDEGQVLKTNRVDIFPFDTVEDLQSRCLPIEHQTCVDFLKDFVAKNIHPITLPSVVCSGEEETLVQVKNIAINLYPHG